MRTKSIIRKQCGTSDFRLAESKDCEPLLRVPAQTAHSVDVFYGSYFTHSDCVDTASKARMIL